MPAPHSNEFPPGGSPLAIGVARVLRRPLDRFLRIEAASGIVLLIAALAALAWANSPWTASYAAVWETPIHVSVGAHTASITLRFVVNDILITVFFFVIGLEIRREIHGGELASLRRATLPLVAALGGMVVPAIVYLVATSGEASRGWGIPMATDAAFALGVLTLLGKRVPSSLRVFLLTLAIVDDIGAIAVIAFYYSPGVEPWKLVIAVSGVLAILAMKRLGVRSALPYVVPACAVWGGVYAAGIHPAIAGVILGLMTPAVSWHGPRSFVDAARESLRELAEAPDHEPSARELWGSMTALRRAHRQALSPADRLESRLHPWVAFGVMPIFALANAGVTLGDTHLGAAPSVAIGVAVGLVLGKPLGIVAATALAVKLRLTSLPANVTWRGLAIIGAVAGVGFTMSLFIAELAFPEGAGLHGLAKIGVLAGSTLATALTLLWGRWWLPAPPPDGTTEARDE